MRRESGRLTATFWDRERDRPVWRERGAGGAMAAAGDILECAVPFADLGVDAGGAVAFFVAVYGGASNAKVEVERHPAQRPIELHTPDALFEARFWRA